MVHKLFSAFYIFIYFFFLQVFPSIEILFSFFLFSFQLYVPTSMFSFFYLPLNTFYFRITLTHTVCQFRWLAIFVLAANCILRCALCCLFRFSPSSVFLFSFLSSFLRFLPSCHSLPALGLKYFRDIIHPLPLSYLLRVEGYACLPSRVFVCVLW